MAIVRKKLSDRDYTKIDNLVATRDDIPDYAVRLYLYMAGFRNGFQLNDTYITKYLGWKTTKIARAKRELKKANLILIDKIDRTTYFLYIGTSTETAQEVKEKWSKSEE